MNRVTSITSERPARHIDPAITSVGFVTCDRPATLERAIKSYLENARRYGRSPRVVVCDDARAREMRDFTRARVTGIASDHGVRVLYAGLEEKRRLAAALETESGVDHEVIEFALFDPTGCGSTFGANRNALQLLTAGELVLCADDDTICKPAVAPDHASGSGTRFVGEQDPTEYWFHDDIGEALAGGRYVDVDVLGDHERLLGRSLATLVRRDPSGVDIAGACPHMLHAIESAHGRVVVTPAGVLGDSGMHSGAHLLIARGPTRDRLLASEAAYRSALKSRAILRAVRSGSVAHPTMLAGTVYGVDNREVRLPFLPVLRNEDGLFCGLLRHCFEDAYFGYPSHALVHAPIEPRAFAPNAYIDALGKSRFTTVLMALVRSLPRSTSTDGKVRREALGRALVDVASQPEPAFRATMRRAVSSFGSAYTAWLENVARGLGEGPEFWSEDVQRQIATHRCASASPTFWLADDLRDGRADEEVALLTQTLVRRYGALLASWNALVRAAPTAALRARL